MTMTEDRNLFVVGGANVWFDPTNHVYYTKVPVSEYLRELAARFSHCTWVVNQAAGGTRPTGMIEPGIEVVPLRGGSAGERFKELITVLSKSARSNYYLIYLPNWLFPLLPVFKARSRQLAVYLANDFNVAIDTYKKSRWPGWGLAYRVSYELPLRAADCVIARGHHLTELARSYNSRVITTVPIGHAFREVRSESARIAKDDSFEKSVLYVGKLIPEKGVKELIQALQTCSGEHPEFRWNLDVVGEGHQMPDLKRLAKEANIGAHIHFHGWVDDPNMIEPLFKRAQVLVVPTTTYPEGVPRVIDEALSLGVPVVATRVGGIPREFRNEEIYLVDPGRPHALATAIQELTTDRTVRAKFLSGARARSHHLVSLGSAAAQHAKVLLGE